MRAKKVLDRICHFTWPLPKLMLLNVFAVILLPLLSWGQNETVSWSENWERVDWTRDWSVATGTWEVGIPTSGPNKAFEPESCAATALAGNYSDGVNTRLIRRTAFKVPSGSENPRLRFWHWYSISDGDTGEVQISTNNGVGWTTISPAYVGTSSGVWSRALIDLTVYANMTVQIAFHFVSHDVANHSDVSTGWYIDVIELITGPMILDIVNKPETFESGLGNWAVERGTWEVGMPKAGPSAAHSLPNCAGTVLSGNYSDGVSTRLISPPLVIPNGDKNPGLQFWHWYSFAEGDTGELQIRVGKSEWQRIPQGQKFSGTSSRAWSPYFVSLINFSDSTVQLAFLFRSTDVAPHSDVSTGWYIDDVEIVTTTRVDEPSLEQSGITFFTLHPNYPNPFNPSTTILYELPRTSQVEVTIFNLLGEKIRTLVSQQQAAGLYRIQWDGRDENGKSMPSGVYLYRLRAGEFVQTRKMVLTQ